MRCRAITTRATQCTRVATVEVPIPKRQQYDGTERLPVCELHAKAAIQHFKNDNSVIYDANSLIDIRWAEQKKLDREQRCEALVGYTRPDGSDRCTRAGIYEINAPDGHRFVCLVHERTHRWGFAKR